MKPFSPKDPEEAVTLGFDFAKVLGAGETIKSAVWEVQNIAGFVVESGMVSGSAKINGSIVRALVIGGVIGETYLHRAKITTTNDQVFVCANQQRIERGGFNAN